MTASRDNNYECVELLLRNGADVNHMDEVSAVSQSIIVCMVYSLILACVHNNSTLSVANCVVYANTDCTCRCRVRTYMKVAPAVTREGGASTPWSYMNGRFGRGLCQLTGMVVRCRPVRTPWVITLHNKSFCSICCSQTGKTNESVAQGRLTEPKEI